MNKQRNFAVSIVSEVNDTQRSTHKWSCIHVRLTIVVLCTLRSGESSASHKFIAEIHVGSSKFTTSCGRSATAAGMREQTMGGWQPLLRSKYGTDFPPTSTMVASVPFGLPQV